MSSFLVLSDIKKRLNAGLKDWLLEKNDKNEVPSIYIGSLPQKTGSAPPGKRPDNSEQSDLPFVLIRPTDGDLSFDGAHTLNQLNVVIVCGISASESLQEYEKGVEVVMNLMDKVIFTVSSFEWYGNNFFSLDSDMKYSYGLGKTLDPYECGLQAAAPFFATVLHVSFNQKTNIPKLEIQHLI